MLTDLRPVALVYRILAVALIATGVARLSDVFSGSPDWSAFLFFTGMSNLLCLVWMTLMLVVAVHALSTGGLRGPSSPWPRLGAAVMLTITVTMLIYVVILAPTASVPGSDYHPYGLTDSLVHVVTPWLVILDWVLFAPKGRLKVWDPLLWTIPPYAYVVFTYVHVALGGDFGLGHRYPYPFLDVDVHGVGGVALWILALSVVFLLIGYLYLGLDRLLARVGRRTTEPASPQLPRHASSCPRGTLITLPRHAFAHNRARFRPTGGAVDGTHFGREGAALTTR